MDNTTHIRRRKITQAQVASRVEHIIDCLARSYKRMQIHDDPTVKQWDMAQTSIDNYIKKAREEVSRYSRQAKTEHLAKSILGLAHLYRKALDDDDSRLALDIIKEQNRLMKLDVTYEQEQNNVVRADSPQEIRDMLDKITIVGEPA